MRTIINVQTGVITTAAEEGPFGTSEERLAAEREGMIVSRFQAKAALSAAGLLVSVEAAIALADATTQLAWADAVEFHRNSATIATLAAALSLSDTTVDDLFRAAALITV